MEKEYLYEYAENALKESLLKVTHEISNGYKVSALGPMFRVANENLRVLKSIEAFSSNAITDVVTDLLIHILKNHSIEVDERKSNIVDFSIYKDSCCIGYIVSEKENWYVNVEKAKSAGIEQVMYIVLQEKTAGEVGFKEPKNNRFTMSGCQGYVNNVLLQDFLEDIGINEFESFKKFAQLYNDAAEDIVGINTAIVPTDGALDACRDTIRTEFNNEEYLDELKEYFSDDELKVFRKTARKNIDILVGYDDFAKSFLSSEWYYNLQKQTDRGLDQTAIVAGYLKSVEQFVYSLIIAHSNRGRKIFVEHKKLTDSTGKKKKYPFNVNFKDTYNLTLGALNTYMNEPRNKFFFQYDNIQATIIRFLEAYCIHTRNGHLHKDNIYTWDKIKKIRNQTYCVYYLLFGTLYINESMRTDLQKKAILPEAEGVEGIDYIRFSEWLTGLMKYDDDIGYNIFYFKMQTNMHTKLHKLEICGMDTYSTGNMVCDENTVPKIIRMFMYTPFIWKSSAEAENLKDEAVRSIERYLKEGEYAKSLKKYQAIIAGDLYNADIVYTQEQN